MVYVGYSGAGKSTLAAGFMQRGYAVLADDVVPVDSLCRALPGFPRIKIWQDVADKLAINTADLRRIRPNTEKFNYPLGQLFTDQPLPIRWVYLLGNDPQFSHKKLTCSSMETKASGESVNFSIVA
jgi:hypothetical protein